MLQLVRGRKIGELTVEDKLAKLTDRLKTAYGDRLVSVILYGSAAMGDWNERHSDLNILCVLAQISARELAESEPILRWWREQGNPPPLLMTPEEIQSSTDCFPIEFHDMQEHRRVLYGRDVIATLAVDRSFYRAQVEHELRAKQIRLRQKAAELFSKPDHIAKLLADAISTFCVLGRHALILSGREARWKKQEIIAALEQALGSRLDAANRILHLRVGRKQEPGTAPIALLEGLLAEFDLLIQFVDGLAR